MGALLEALAWDRSRRRQRLLLLTGGLCALEGYGELYRENIDDVRKWLAKQQGP